MANQIDKLTPEQWIEADALYKKALEIGYSTEPVDRPRLEIAYRESVKRTLNLDVQEIVWCDSPEHARRILREEAYSEAEISDAAHSSGWAFSWSYFVQFCDKLLPDVLTAENKELLAYTLDLAAGGIFWVFERAVLACERPTILKVNDQGRLNSLDGPAIAWKDGYALYSVDGVRVEAKYVLDPLNSLTLDVVTKERNAETRRALMLLYGTQRYLRDTGAKLTDSTPHERLFELNDGSRILLANDHSTNRVYTLTAPRTAQTVQAVEQALYGVPFKNLLARS